MLSKTALENLYTQLSTNNTSENAALGLQLMNLSQRNLLQKYFNNETSITLPTVANQQAYKLPQNYSKMKDVTISVGTIKYTLREVQTRTEWDLVNQYPWTAQIPWYYFIYNGYVNIFPIPSGTGNTITYNYKLRVTDLSISDVTSGTVSVVAGSDVITGVGTNWAPTVGINETRWIQIPFPAGDNQWYQIASVDSATSLTLYNVYQGTTNISGANYVMGQMPILMEDFHEMLVFDALSQYYSSGINKNLDTASKWESKYNEGIQRLDAYAGSKSTGVGLEGDIPLLNPNLYYMG